MIVFIFKFFVLLFFLFCLFFFVCLFLLVCFCFHHLIVLGLVCWFVSFFLFLCCLFFFLLFVLCFLCLFFFSFLFLFALALLHNLQTLGYVASGWAWTSGVGTTSSGCWTTREFLGPWNINCCTLPQRCLSQRQDLASPNCLWDGARHLTLNNEQNRNKAPPISGQTV